MQHSPSAPVPRAGGTGAGGADTGRQLANLQWVPAGLCPRCLASGEVTVVSGPRGSAWSGAGAAVELTSVAAMGREREEGGEVGVGGCPVSVRTDLHPRGFGEERMQGDAYGLRRAPDLPREQGAVSRGLGCQPSPRRGAGPVGLSSSCSRVWGQEQKEG